VVEVLVLFFGRLREAAGTGEMEIAVAGGSVADLRAMLAAGNPILGEALAAPGIRVAIDQRIAADDAPIAGAREIAFMPPMSGG
jgi:sulfur-carrier protein